jgi:diguanylate cyclase (GGDEF)-like protein/putative nucleotidyltransferase with HDIG domain
MARASHRQARSGLMRLVFAASLVLVLGLGLGLAVIASEHVSSAAVGTATAADHALVAVALQDLGAVVSTSTMTEEAAGAAQAVLDRLVRTAGLEWATLLGPDGVMRAQAGQSPGPGWTQPMVDLSKPGALFVQVGSRPVLLETFPASIEGRLTAVVEIARDGAPLLAAVESARRDIAVGTAIGAIVLIAVLFLIFRGAQRRLDTQTEQLIEATRRDPLTGVLNHGAAVLALVDALDALVEQPVAIGLVDLDNFRRINEVHGHDLGDRALRAVAAILTESLDPAHVVGRSGPDEFVVVAPGLDGARLQARLMDARSKMVRLGLDAADGSRLPLTVSASVTLAPLHGRTPTELLSAAAMTLGEVKSAGGDAVAISRLSYAELAQERRGTFAVLDGLIQAIDTRDRYTRRHSEDVARYALFLANEFGIEDELLTAIHRAALLHDVGKIAVPNDILRKPGPLTSEEMEIMKQHVVLGGALVRDLDDGELVADGVLHHHERWDGTGYASGLSGDGIPLIARIIAVADAFSAMTTSRPYRRALEPGEALQRLVAAADTQLDPRLVDVFVIAMESQPDPPQASDERQPTHWLQLVAAQ